MIAANLLLTETLVALPRAAVLMNEPLNEVIRWSKRGLNGVRLESKYSRERRVVVTSVEALGRFLVKVGVKSLSSSASSGTH